MVSLRRRRLLGLCSGGVQNSVVDKSAVSFENTANAIEIDGISSKPANVHPILPYDLNLPPRDNDNVDDPFEECGSPIVSNHNQPEEQSNVCVSSSSKEATQEEVVKRRKQYRRRNEDSHVSMKGVYMKNSKWQAAIKVDKIQIHLGTLSSQDEAVHLYDRAAFVCGRETNLVLSHEEKEELRKLNWDDFLAKTRREMSGKRTRRSHVKRTDAHSAQNSDTESGQATESLSTPNDATEQN